MKKRPALSLSLASSDKDEHAPSTSSSYAMENGPGGTTTHSMASQVSNSAPDFSEALEAASHVPSAVQYEDLEFLKTLGKGCSSVVQLARHKKTGELYALKQIPLYDKAVRSMLLAELKALYSADCEALVGFHGAAYREGEIGVVLEFMDLGGLDGVLRRAPGRRIPEHALAAMAYQVLFGLGYLAFERRVHRDLKPANILVAHDGRVKLTDFGISRELQTSVLAKTFIGSFLYMSPERVRHEAYDYSSDIWSLGLVLLECADGKYPYPQSSAQIAMVMNITEGDEPLPPPDSGYTDEFRHFLSKCIVKDPKKRSSAMELLEEPWFERHGVASIEDGVDKTRAWLESSGFKDEYAAYRGVPSSSAASASAGGGSAVKAPPPSSYAAAVPSAGAGVVAR